MNAGLLPLALLSAALGLAISAAPRKMAWISVGMLAMISMLTWALVGNDLYGVPMLLGFWGSTALTAAFVYLPRGLTGIWAVIASANAGIWLGTLADSSGGWRGLALMLPLALLFLPGAWLVQQGFGIGVKIVASWIVAISLLAGMVSMTPTPGYAPDHME